MIRTSNPVLQKDTFSKVYSYSSQGTMTVQGTVNKTLILLLCVIAMASLSWGKAISPGFLMLGSIAAIALSFVMFFKPHLSPVLAPAYALAQGIFIGNISGMFEKMYPGLVMQAVMLTFGVLATMLFLYKTQIIRVTDRFVKIMIIGMGAILFC